jgi:hypothetical protein
MNIFYKIKIVFVLGIWSLAVVAFADDGINRTPTSQELCDRYANYLSLLKNIKFTTHLKTSLKSPHNNSFDSRPSQALIILTENAAKYEETLVSSIQVDSRIIDQPLKQEILYEEKKGVMVLKEGDQLVVNADFETFPKDFAERTRYLSEKVFFGYEFWGNKEIRFLPVILKNAKLSLNFDEQKKQWMLNADTNDSNFKIYFEDVNAGVPQQIVFSKLLDKRKLSDIVSIDFKISKFQTIAGVQVPLEMEIIRESLVPAQQVIIDPLAPPKENKNDDNLATAKFRTTTTHAVWSDVSFVKKDVASNFKLEQFIKIPNGTEVHVRNALQIEHVWMDGEIVPKTDEVALRIARGDHKFMPGPKEPRFWFIALGIIMLLLGGGMKLRDMLKES